MSFDKFQCFYTVEQANNLLEYSDISDDDVDVPEAFFKAKLVITLAIEKLSLHSLTALMTKTTAIPLLKMRRKI